MKIREIKNKIQNTAQITTKYSKNYLFLLHHQLINNGYKTALFISAICTIYVAISTRTDNNATAMALRMPSTPNLKSYMIANSKKPQSGIKIKNTGLGPLLIKDIKFFKRDKPIPIKNTSYSLGKEFGLNRERFSINTIHPKDALQQGEERWLIKSIGNSSFSSKRVRDVANNIGIIACYCSINNVCHTKEFGWEVQYKMKCQ